MTDIRESLLTLPERSYRVILSDPPWRFSAGTKSRPQHYPRMTLKEIAGLPVKRLAHPEGCRLFLWITAPLLNRIGDILDPWGFRYSTSRVWMKLWPGEDSMFIYSDSVARGTGYEVQGNAEILVIAKRGKPQSIKGKPWPSFIISPRREHSRKPDEVRDEIASRLEGPRLEMFARSSSPGWETIGNQRDKFDGRAA